MDIGMCASARFSFAPLDARGLDTIHASHRVGLVAIVGWGTLHARAVDGPHRTTGEADEER